MFFFGFFWAPSAAHSFCCCRCSALSQRFIGGWIFFGAAGVLLLLYANKSYGKNTQWEMFLMCLFFVVVAWLLCWKYLVLKLKWKIYCGCYKVFFSLISCVAVCCRVYPLLVDRILVDLFLRIIGVVQCVIWRVLGCIVAIIQRDLILIIFESRSFFCVKRKKGNWRKIIRIFKARMKLVSWHKVLCGAKMEETNFCY